MGVANQIKQRRQEGNTEQTTKKQFDKEPLTRGRATFLSNEKSIFVSHTKEGVTGAATEKQLQRFQHSNT